MLIELLHCSETSEAELRVLQHLIVLHLLLLDRRLRDDVQPQQRIAPLGKLIELLWDSTCLVA